MFGDEFLAQGLHLKSHKGCSAGIRTWFSADQSSSFVNIVYIPIHIYNFKHQGDYEHKIIQPWLPVSQKYK